MKSVFAKAWPSQPTAATPQRRPVLLINLRELEATRLLGVDVFTCAHHWVTDDSILDYLLRKEPHPRVKCKHDRNCRCNHAAVVAGMVFAMLNGRKFPPLYLRVHENRVRGAVSSIELIDGHHRLRARQFLRNTDNIRWAVKGDVALLRRTLVQARRER